jgi:hypothetical protein
VSRKLKCGEKASNRGHESLSVAIVEREEEKCREEKICERRRKQSMCLCQYSEEKLMK